MWEDEGIEPTVELKYGDSSLTPGQDYDVSFLYDIVTKSGTATITLKGIYRAKEPSLSQRVMYMGRSLATMLSPMESESWLWW